MFALFFSFIFLISRDCMGRDCIGSMQAYKEGIKQARYYQTSQGHVLRYTHFKTPLTQNKKTIFFVQGRGTFLEFYEVLIVPLLERGFDVWMYDLTGQGGSSRILKEEKHDPLSVQ